MIINYEQYKAFSELSPHEKIEHFSIKDRCVKSHVDTLYYSVSVCSDNGEEPPEGILGLLTDLEALKQNKLVSYEAYVEFFGLSVENIRFANYEYCLRLNETFDICKVSSKRCNSEDRCAVENKEPRTQWNLSSSLQVL